MRRFTTPRRPAHTIAAARGGTTLTEVLMSLLIMGIGLVSVATLFPLSVLRSIEATQQTTATAARYGAEAAIDGSGTEPVYTLGSTPPTLMYNRRPGMPVAPNPSTYLSGCITAAIALDPDGDHDPMINDTDYVAAQHMYGYSTTNHRDGFYVVDPLGYWRLRQQGEPHAAGALPVTATTHGAQFFGDWTSVGGAPRFPPPGGSSSMVHWNINRFSLNIPSGAPSTFTYMTNLYGFTGSPGSFSGVPDEIERNARIAELSVGLPDSFITVADGRMSEGAVTVTADAIDFEPPADSEIASIFIDPLTGGPDPVMINRGQVTVLAADGRGSLVRKLAADLTAGEIGAGNLRFKSALPATFFSAGVDRVVVEAVEDRYTWMLTVRRREPSSLIDVVVFFRRAFGRQDEHVYLVTQNFDNIAQFNQRKLEQKEYFVAWDDTQTATGPIEPRPDFKEGDWMFDPVNFRWHKIGQIIGEESIDPSIWSADVLNALGFPAGTTYAANKKIVFRLEGAQQADEPVRRGILMDGIVDVYPIEPKGTGN